MGFLIKDMGKGNRRPLISHMEAWGAQGISKPSGYFAKCLLSKAGKNPWYLDSILCYGNISDEQKKTQKTKNNNNRKPNQKEPQRKWKKSLSPLFNFFLEKRKRPPCSYKIFVLLSHESVNSFQWLKISTKPSPAFWQEREKCNTVSICCLESQAFAISSCIST